MKDKVFLVVVKRTWKNDHDVEIWRGRMFECEADARRAFAKYAFWACGTSLSVELVRIMEISA